MSQTSISIPREEEAWLRNMMKLQAAMRLRKISGYHPYPKQAEFHSLGKSKRERVLLAGNQQGKTWCAGNETSFHATGDYPDDWNGRVWNRATNGWVGSESYELVRDVAQRYLLGPREEWGTGTIPATSFADEPKMSRAISGLVDSVRIKHVSGGTSTLAFKAYQQGRSRWQGSKLDFIWLDEEPDPDIYSEALARLTATGGMLFMTMTPLLGLSEVVEQFYPEPDTPQRGTVQMGIEDALHIDPAERETIIAGYRKHEREARTEGIPMLGSGKVFDFAVSDVICDPFRIPDFWPKMNGIDFGYGDHPTGMVQIAWDRDKDCVYLSNAVKEERPIPALHASTMKQWGETVPVAWPHDGHRQWGDSLPYVEKYIKEQLKMLGTHACFRTGGYSTEAGVKELYDRFSESRLKFFSNLSSFHHEFTTYHRKDGLLVKRNDDLLSALRNAVMMLRFARVETASQAAIKVVTDYDELGGDYLS